VRADQVLAIDQAFEKLIDRDARDSTQKSDNSLPIRSPD
jgi:hypothetical protein